MITKTYDLILWSCNHTSKFPLALASWCAFSVERNSFRFFPTPADRFARSIETNGTEERNEFR